MISGKAGWKIAVMVTAFLIAVPAFFVVGCGGGQAQVVSGKTSEEIVRKIDQLIYPTLGYPQIVTPGGDFTFEFDFTLDDAAKSQPDTVASWQAAITASNSPASYQADLDITGVELGSSSRWQQGSGRQVYDIYKVTARVPEDVPPDLYDLEVTAGAGGEDVTDSQPNCVSVAANIDGDYKVVQLTDIHVFDIEYPTSCSHDRALHDAIYLQKAIDQVNLIHPDFVIFTGDLIFGQKYLPADWPPDDTRTGSSEYEYEYLWAYNAMSALDVPCFMVMGNHDGYNDTVKDGYKWWTQTFGPLYYSFDYGDDHYTMIDTMDWSREDRTLEKGMFYAIAQILQPVKWLGQLRSGGDKFGDAQAPPVADYSGQLGWIRDDLASDRLPGLKIVSCHHDPAQVSSWDDADYFGYRIGGKGEGRMALQKLCADYKVNMVLSGHEHHDLVSEIPWSSGGGSTVSANTTALEPRCDVTMDYPGYRMVQIAGDRIASYNYQPPKWSYPYYKGVVVGQATDMDPLYEPAIAVDFSNSGDWAKKEKEVSCTVNNSLNAEFNDCSLEFFMPSLPAGSDYTVSGANNAEVTQVSVGNGWVEVYVGFTLEASGTSRITVSPD